MRAGKVTLLDHFNINHEGKRQDVLRAFYFDCLGLSADPRKQQNIDNGVGTLWANGGTTQFHFSKGDTAQVFDGLVEMSYRSEEDLAAVVKRLGNPPSCLQEASSVFGMTENDNGSVTCTDYHGTTYLLRVNALAEDRRGGVQPGPKALPCAAISSLEVNVPESASLAGISRWYNRVLGAPTVEMSESCLEVAMSPLQTLRFRRTGRSVPHSCPHDDVRNTEEGLEANYGLHISVYVHDFAAAFTRANELGSIFVNNRFQPRVHRLEDAVDQGTFRTLNVVDPDNTAAGSILKFEHEVMSMILKDGSKNKLFPLLEIPPE
jgi:hypothetical protein